MCTETCCLYSDCVVETCCLYSDCVAETCCLYSDCVAETCCLYSDCVLQRLVACTMTVCYRDLAVELPFTLTHPKPVESPLPTRAPSMVPVEPGESPVDTNLIQFDTKYVHLPPSLPSFTHLYCQICSVCARQNPSHPV